MIPLISDFMDGASHPCDAHRSPHVTVYYIKEKGEKGLCKRRPGLCSPAKNVKCHAINGYQRLRSVSQVFSSK